MGRTLWIAATLPMLTVAAPNYKAERTVDHGIDVVRLTDIARDTVISIAPSLGNRAYEFKIHGKNILYFALPDIAALKNSPRPPLNGIPFLAPWANRIPDGGFWSGTKRYLFNPGLSTARIDRQGIAIHGMLTTSPLWEVTAVEANSASARLTSKLAFWKYPELMANWPFAHDYEVTYQLSGGVLEVVTTIKNLGARDMPVSIGYHPYFQIPDVPRAEWTAHIPARKHVETDARLVATGQLTDSNLPEKVSLHDHNFDDGFTDLVRNAAGKAIFSVSAGGKRVEVEYGKGYEVAVIFAPPGQSFICFEPMTAITNGINLAHEGKYNALQVIAAGGTWEESFRIRASGF